MEPPTWLKYPAAHNHGTLVWETRYRKAYANYLVRFIKAYAELGLSFEAIHVQNKPDSDQKFPSCVWPGTRLRDFFRDDLGPTFLENGIGTGIWLGTIERGSYNDWVLPVPSDPEAARFVSGVGFQWAGRIVIQNPLDRPVGVNVATGTGTVTTELPACSVSTLTSHRT